MVIVGVPVNASLLVNSTVMVSPTFAYQVLVVLLELNVVVHVRTGVSLSILICTEVLIASVLFNVSTE